MASVRNVIKNKIFIGVPWARIRPKYEEAVKALCDEYPADCVIMGRNTEQEAKELWDLICRHIEESASAIFDATGSNPNVALEFGYAKGVGKRCVLARNERKPREGGRTNAWSIMSDLAGTVRAPWKTVKGLRKILADEFRQNPYVRDFLIFVRRHRYGARQKKVAVAAIRELAGRRRMRKPDLMLALEQRFPNVTTVDMPKVVDQLVAAGLLIIKRGRYGGISIPRATD